MNVRDMVAERTAEMATELPPARARQILIELTALYGNCLEDARKADHAYNVVLLRFLGADEAANRAKIRAETSLEYLEKRAAHDTLEIVMESIRSLKVMLRSLEEEMRLAR